MNIIHDDKGLIFNVYFSNNNCNIEIIILRTPEVPILKVFHNLGYYQVTNLNKKISQTNFTVEIYKFFFNLNLYMLGKNPSSMYYKISNASLKLLKKLVRLYPNNYNVKNE